MKCKKCSKNLTGKQTSYCSPRCSKNHLKSLYRKRNKEKINKYNRHYRSLGINPLKSSRKKKVIESLGGICKRCGANQGQLDLHHIKPLRCGGDNKRQNLLLLCSKCHQLLHQMWSMDFWENNK